MGTGVGWMTEEQDFNRTHPEREEGEVFVGNYWPNGRRLDGDDSKGTNLDVFPNLPYKSKRLGEVAYDWNGGILEDAQPMFAQESEVRDYWSRQK